MPTCCGSTAPQARIVGRLITPEGCDFSPNWPRNPGSGSTGDHWRILYRLQGPGGDAVRLGAGRGGGLSAAWILARYPLVQGTALPEPSPALDPRMNMLTAGLAIRPLPLRILPTPASQQAIPQRTEFIAEEIDASAGPRCARDASSATATGPNAPASTQAGRSSPVQPAEDRCIAISPCVGLPRGDGTARVEIDLLAIHRAGRCGSAHRSGKRSFPA